MKTFSYEEIGNLTVTFIAGSDVTEGGVVKAFGDHKVDGCNEGDKFCGVAGKICDDMVGVQMRGFMKVRCNDALPRGSCKVVADGQGGIKEGDGVLVAVIEQIIEEGTVLIFM